MMQLSGHIARGLVSALLLAASVGVGTVLAQPSTSATLTFAFTDCVGPAGTPSSFEAVKQPGNAAAMHLTDGSGNFIVTGAVDMATGVTLFDTPGMARNGLPLISCDSVHPVTNRAARVSGFLTPVGSARQPDATTNG